MAKAYKYHFTRLQLQNWRNFSDLDVRLQKRVFLVGPNASGKSNFLDVFRFLRDVAKAGGGLQSAIQSRGGVKSLRCLLARRHSDVSVGVEIGTGTGDATWSYRLTFNQDQSRRPLIKSETVTQGGKVILERPDEHDRQDPERLSQTHLEQVYVNQAFRELNDFFAATRYLHIVPQLIREPDRSVGRSGDPFGGDFLEQIASTNEKTRQSRLKKILRGLQAAVPQLEDLILERDSRGVPHLKGKYSHWRPQGAWQNEEELSDGTLRLLGLLWSILDGHGTLLLEEPELSLHPEVVRILPGLFARTQRQNTRQVFISTHSADLLHDEGIGLDEVLLLTPRKEGTTITDAASLEDARTLLEGGMNLSEIVIPKTRPSEMQLLLKFDE